VINYRLLQADRKLARLPERLRQDNPQAVAVDPGAGEDFGA